MLAWRRFKAQLCPYCGRPWGEHEEETPDDYATGWLECPAAEQIARARAAYAKDPRGVEEAERVKQGGADPREWRQWIHWPAGSPPPEFPPLD